MTTTAQHSTNTFMLFLHQRWHALATLSPGLLVITIFLIVPSFMLMGIAFMTNGPYGLPEMPLSLDAFRRLAGFGILGWSPGNLLTLWRSVWQTVIATSLVILISYPVAYYISRRPERLQPLLLLIVIVPSWTNQVIRAFAWMNLLAPGSTLTNLAYNLGFMSEYMGLFPSTFAVILGLVYNFLPFMVLPLYASFQNLDHRLVQAARDLYAPPVKAFFQAVFPQTLPGLMAGTVLVSIPAFGMYVVPDLLGGGKSMMIGSLVARQFSDASNWPLGAAAAMFMIIATLLGLLVLRRVGQRAGGGQEVVL